MIIKFLFAMVFFWYLFCICLFRRKKLTNFYFKRLCENSSSCVSLSYAVKGGEVLKPCLSYFYISIVDYIQLLPLCFWILITAHMATFMVKCFGSISDCLYGTGEWRPPQPIPASQPIPEVILDTSTMGNYQEIC